MDKPMNLEDVLQDLYDSEINVAISWLWDGGIDIGLGDELNGYVADGQVRTVAEAAAWLRDHACPALPGQWDRTQILRLRLSDAKARSAAASTVGKGLRMPWRGWHVCGKRQHASECVYPASAARIYLAPITTCLLVRAPEPQHDLLGAENA
jgi:hypothetical protein